MEEGSSCDIPKISTEWLLHTTEIVFLNSERSLYFLEGM
jgi:hypothetical protein